MTKIKKIALSSIVGVSALVSGYYSFLKPALGGSEPLSTNDNNSQTTTTQSSTSSTAATTSGNYKDGTYTGSVVDTSKGEFQVSVTVTGGNISKIDMLVQPDEDFSKNINKKAIPQYIEQAINTQSSEINLVSGASETFKGFKGSLQDALNQAK